MAHEELDSLAVGAQDAILIHSVEGQMEAVDEAELLPLVTLVRLEQKGAERGAKRQRVDGRDDDRDGHRDPELAVERTADPGDERHGHEDRSHDERDGDDSARDLMHSVHTGRAGGVVALVQLGVYGLDDDDGVIHDDSDRQHQCREREEVQREAEDLQEEERTDERHGHRDGGDERAAEVLQEDIYDDEDEEEGLEERLDDVPDRGVEEVRDVEDVGHLHAGREVLLQLLDLGLDGGDDVVSVGASDLRDHPRDSGVAVGEGVTAVAEGAQLDLRHVLEADDVARIVGLDDDVLVLGDALQTALVAERILIGAVTRLAEAPWGSLEVLRREDA